MSYLFPDFAYASVITTLLLESSTQKLLESEGDLKGKRFLDVGSGAGHVSLLASELVGPEGQVTAIDFDPVIIDLARKDAEEISIGNITYDTMDKINQTVLQQVLADQASIEKVFSDLKRFTIDVRSVISLPRIFRLTGVRG